MRSARFFAQPNTTSWNIVHCILRAMNISRAFGMWALLALMPTKPNTATSDVWSLCIACDDDDGNNAKSHIALILVFLSLAGRGVLVARPQFVYCECEVKTAIWNYVCSREFAFVLRVHRRSTTQTTKLFIYPNAMARGLHLPKDEHHESVISYFLSIKIKLVVNFLIDRICAVSIWKCIRRKCVKRSHAKRRYHMQHYAMANARRRCRWVKTLKPLADAENLCYNRVV